MNKLMYLIFLAAIAVVPYTQAQTETGDATQTPDNEITGTVSTFAELSPGNQKVARALMDAQVLSGDGTEQAWTLDQIAAAKSETGWGQVFTQMQAEGMITARNLGEVVSSYQHNTAATVLDGSSTIPMPGIASGNHAENHSKGTRSGMSMSSSIGSAHGVQKSLPISANHGITTAAGADISIGLNHTHSNRAGINFGSGTSVGSSASGSSAIATDNAVRGMVQGRALGHGNK